jgi:glycosyltransferase involved in cell wall biosynthesis
MMETWARRDSRVLVLRKQNGGLSSARNYALDIIKEQNLNAPYLLFVDSDDALEEHALEMLYKKAQDEQLDILLFNAKTIYETADLQKGFPNHLTYFQRNALYDGVFKGRDYLCRVVAAGDFKAPVWLQLYRTAFLFEENMRFYPGIIHEDNLFTLACLLEAKRVSYLDEAFYIRRIRENSIVTEPVSWKNVDGYFRCGLEAISLLSKKDMDYTQGEDVQLSGLVRSFFVNAVEKYKQTNAEDRLYLKRLYTSTEYLLFDLLVVGPVCQEQHITAEIRNEYNNSVSYRVGRALTFLPRKLSR